MAAQSHATTWAGRPARRTLLIFCAAAAGSLTGAIRSDHDQKNAWWSA